MGTSVSQASPKTSNWKPIFAYYSNSEIPELGVIKEVWRASEMENFSMSHQIKSDIMYECYKAVSSSKSPQEAITKFNQTVIKTKGNSIVAEFAKRVIPSAFQSQNPSERWKAGLFSELTKYVVSRDASGFVGENCRNKTVNELIDFKARIGRQVSEIISSEQNIIRNKRDWNSFVNQSVVKLKSVK